MGGRGGGIFTFLQLEKNFAIGRVYIPLSNCRGKMLNKGKEEKEKNNPTFFHKSKHSVTSLLILLLLFLSVSFSLGMSVCVCSVRVCVRAHVCLVGCVCVFHSVIGNRIKKKNQN